MELLVLVLLFAAIGYIAAVSRLGRHVDRATGKVTSVTRSWADRVEAGWKAIFHRRNSGDALRAWAKGGGSSLLPPDFKIWLASLSDGEAMVFSKALAESAHTLGFDLDTLIEGGLDQQPILRQVFVEAIVVYSSAYRKAKQARQQAEADEAGKTAPAKDGKKPAEKRAAGRDGEAPVEAGEPAAAA